MAGNANFNRVVPSTQDPNISSQQTQIVPINALVGELGMQTYAEQGDIAVYRLNLLPQTPTMVNQSRVMGQVNEVNYSLQQISTPMYNFKLRAVDNYYENKAMSRFNIPHTELLIKGMEQGLAQSMVSAFFYGAMGSTGEGFLNTVPVTIAPTYTPIGGTATNKWSLIDPIQLFTTIMAQFRKIGANTLNRGVVESVVVSNRLYQLLTKTFPLTNQYAGFFGQAISVWSAVQVSLYMANPNLPVPNLVATDLLQGNATNPDYMCFVTPTMLYDDMYNSQNAFGSVLNDNRLVTMVQAGNPTLLTGPLSAENVELVTFVECTSGWVLVPNANSIVTALYQ